TVVDGDHVDLPGLHVGGQDTYGGPLRGVPGRAAVDQEHLAGAQVGSHRRLHLGPLLGAHDQHDAPDVVEGEHGADRPGEHGRVAEGEEHLVDRGPDTSAGAGCQDHDGDGHQAGTTSAVAIAATPSPRPV